jgi:hypothetical protein
MQWKFLAHRLGKEEGLWHIAPKTSLNNLLGIWIQSLGYPELEAGSRCSHILLIITTRHTRWLRGRLGRLRGLGGAKGRNLGIVHEYSVQYDVARVSYWGL